MMMAMRMVVCGSFGGGGAIDSDVEVMIKMMKMMAKLKIMKTKVAFL